MENVIQNHALDHTYSEMVEINESLAYRQVHLIGGMA